MVFLQVISTPSFSVSDCHNSLRDHLANSLPAQHDKGAWFS